MVPHNTTSEEPTNVLADIPNETPPRTLQERLDALNPARTERILTDLVNLYSPSESEYAAVDYCARFLRSHGAQVTLQPVDARGRHNVIAQTSEAPIGLLFLGHLDTVLKWFQGDYRARCERGYFLGLGSADMKSGCAAMMEAFLSLCALPVSSQRSIGLALVVGEEQDGDGIEALVQVVRPELAVIGEPTSMRLCPSHFGYLEVLLTAQGRRAHSALPELGDNAIDGLLHVLHGLRTPLQHEAPEWNRPALVCNLRELRGGGNAFVVPEYGEAILDIHLPPNISAARVAAELQQRLAGMVMSGTGLTCTLSVKIAFDGYALGESDPFLGQVERVGEQLGMALEPKPFRSHSDANCLYLAGCRPVVIGPGDLETAHTVHERVPMDELHRATRLYTGIGVAYSTQPVAS